MNEIQNRKAQNIEKAFPGCLGRMVNLFDLSNGFTGNKLLTDKPHRDGSSLSRSQSDVARVLSAPFGDQIEDKMTVTEFRRSSSNKKANRTAMKTLIAQEMSKEVVSKHNPPNVVAKLMGLDTLPHRQHDLAAQRSQSRGHSRRSLSHSGILVEDWEQDHGFLDKQVQYEEHNEYKDVYEIWQQPQKMNTRDGSPLKGKDNESINEKKMALVRQKFIEAKRLATDERARQTKEFQDALDVLSSNRDLLLKFLHESNSTFSQNSPFSHHLYDMQSNFPPAETKRITVLRPSKTLNEERFAGSGIKIDKQTNKPAQMGQATGWHKNNSANSPSFADRRIEEFPSQPTRIVVLKPSPGKTYDAKAAVSPPCSSPRLLHNEDFYGEPIDDEAQEPREAAKEIPRRFHENLAGHRRDETLLSSVFSNGYIGDDSSFNKSENEYVVGNLSDSEIMSPTSRHSWDYVNRFGSPYSCSSFSRASCSPESSVCREAKKRLSERWAMMTSNGSSQEQKTTRRSSSTLGEMLALSETKKLERFEEETANKEQEPRVSAACLTSDFKEEEDTTNSPKVLLRSKSLPVTSTVYGARINGEVSGPIAGKIGIPKELTKGKSTKSSLKGKVSSLFFSRNKGANKEKSGVSQFKDESQSDTFEASRSSVAGKIDDDASQCFNDSSLEECVFPDIDESSRKHTYPDAIGVGAKGIVSQEGGLSVAKPLIPGNLSENQDQPSPISVLEPSFEEDDSTTAETSGNVKPDYQGREVLSRSNLIDKSPPIESIARTLSWDDSCAETATPYSLKPSSFTSIAEEEEDWRLFVQTLLSAAALDGKAPYDLFYVRWHSPESPLDPSLRDSYANLNDKQLLLEAKRRQRRSYRKLAFDCVNAALLEITGHHGSDISTRAMLHAAGDDNRLMEVASPTLLDYIWAYMKEWFCSEVRCTFGDGGDSTSLVEERAVVKEVVGKGWVDSMRLELDNLGKEIEGKLLEELVEEAVVDLTGRRA